VHKILSGGSHVDQVRAYVSSGPRDLLDKNSCQEFAGRMKNAGWTAAKVNILRDQKWTKLDNRRLSNLEVDRNSQGFENLREAVGPELDIAVHCHWELCLATCPGCQCHQALVAGRSPSHCLQRTMGKTYGKVTGTHPLW